MKILIRFLSVMLSIGSGLALQAIKLDHQLQEFIFDTTVVNTPDKNFKADLSFLFIDFKYDNKLKICEFGRAKTASTVQRFVFEA